MAHLPVPDARDGSQPHGPSISLESIPERFEQVVRQHPDQLAVKMGDRSLTYSELNQAANRIARAILDKRGPGNEPIALLFEHGVNVVAAIFGVLKAGKFLVALDPSFPQERRTYILEDSQASLIVTNSRNLGLAKELTKGARVAINTDEFDACEASDDLGLSVASDHLAMLFYTSGSTGSPKGVIKTHRGCLENAMLNASAMSTRTDDRLTLLHAVCFGSSEADLYSSLLNGAALLLFDIKAEGIRRFASWLREERVTICHLPPALFRELAVSLSGEHLPHLRLLRLSGAPITQPDFDLYKKNFPSGALLETSMGSTESGGICSAVLDRNFSFPKEGAPVGYCRTDKRVLLLDDNGHEVPDGQDGEIAVRSRVLSPGYWNNPELTKAKFLPDPGGGNDRIFLTGDTGRMLADGFLIHLGRKDFQVKIRGYRVETPEIERALLAHPRVKEAGIVAWDREPGEKYLVAYVVSRAEPAPTINELRDFLKQTLPDYMIPSAFMFLESLPFMNGKLDRRSLPKPDAKRPELSRPYAPPRSEVERMLAEIWAEILSLDQVGVHDNFFDLGGHSLAATRVVSQVMKKFRLELPIKSLFESPTVAAMAAVINEYQEKRLPEEELEHVLTELESMSEEEAKKIVAAHWKG